MSGDDEHGSLFERSAVTRREALRAALAGGVLVGAGGLLAACGSEDVDVPTSNFGATSLKDVRSGGTLRIGVAGGGADDSIDAHVLATVPDISRAFQLYEPLAGRDAESEFELVLAESIEPEKGAETWTIRLRPGVTFHNGKPVTADDVLFSLARIIDPKDPKTGAASISYIDLERSRKLDRRTVRIQLKFPNVGFPDDVGQYFNSIVPTDYDPKEPVGTGPFMYESFVAGERSVFVKNPDYWRGGLPRVDEIVIIDFPDDTPRLNALLSGQVDGITNLPPGQIAQVKSNTQFQVLISETGGWQPFTMRVDKAPFDDVRVRQAMRLLVDREQMIAQVLSGQGRVANDLYSPYDPAYNDELPQRKQDLEQAKSLLKQAGKSDLRVELVTSPVFQGIVEAAQVIAEQAKGAGVTIKVRKVDPGTFYGDNYLQWTFAQDFWATRTYLSQVAQGSLPDSPFNETHWEDPEFLDLIARARAELDDAQRADLLKEAQRIEHERGGLIVWSFSNQVDAYSSTVGGFSPARSGFPLTNYGFGRVGFVG
jgi:peptide/nickel transport system substrate-binding protein